MVASTAPLQSKRKRYLNRKKQLDDDFLTWEPTLKEIADFIEPYRGRFTGREIETNRGERRDQNIINCEPGLDVEIQAAGMMAGLTSPSRPWVKTETTDPELNDYSPVKEWLDLATRRLLRVCEMSNLYSGLHQLYADICPFGTSVLHVDEDPVEVICASVFPIGTYRLANNSRNRVDSCYRELKMTVGQLVDEFKLERCSAQVQAQYKNDHTETWVRVLHAMQPNTTWAYNRIGPAGMHFSSCWLELQADETAGFLREAGYEEQPFVAPRWSTNGVDVYGRGPGHRALGDVKQLQTLERRKLQGIDKLIDPPMLMPSAYRDLQVSLRPGSQIYADSLTGSEGAKPALIIDPRGIEQVRLSIAEVVQLIAKAMHANLWMMLAQVEAGKMTATEVQARKGEQMLQLGPMLERFFNECLRPLLRRILGIMLRRGLLPPAPPELHGQELRFEFTSILAQAQKATGIQGMREVAGFIIELANGQKAAGVPVTVMDTLDTDKLVDEYSSAIGTPANVVRSEDERQKIRSDRRAAEAQVQRQQELQQGAETAKTLAAADTSGQNALTNVLDAIGQPKPPV